ncbi:MAG: hypothetical protein LDL31_03840 [Prosthecobacter sp.]|jgi:rhodanese-related sulfurtransferase|nr:hypothetical protein [Prosthecobacter sp.]
MRTTLFQAILLVGLAALAGFATFHLHPRAPSLWAVETPLAADEVTVKQVQERWGGRVLWLDARPREQFEKEHIPDARLLNEQDFDALLLELLEELQRAGKPVVIYCSGQRCEASRKVREKLLTVVPLEDCYILQGGWPAWQQAQKR